MDPVSPRRHCVGSSAKYFGGVRIRPATGPSTQTFGRVERLVTVGEWFRVYDSSEGAQVHRQLVEPNFARCFQLMEYDESRLIQQWVLDIWRGSGA